MNKSKLFKLAHKLTKKVIKAGDNYRVTFGACIKVVKAAYFGATEATLKSWNKNGENRVYINFEVAHPLRKDDTIDAKAGFVIINADYSVNYENVAEEYRQRVINAAQAFATYQRFEDECESFEKSTFTF